MHKILEDYKVEFEKELKNYLKDITSENVITRAYNYSILNGGKRIRPILVYLGAISVSNDLKNIPGLISNLSIGIELIHSYSLVHDDLPCMDNDKYRRGKLTTHAKFGAGMATITGDAMLNGAAEVMLSCINNDFAMNYPYVNNNYKAQINAARYILDCSGLYGMIGGQAIDIQNKKLSKDELLSMYKLKTSALLKGALVSGAMRFEADDEIISKFIEYADNFGIVFQIVDDILDKTSTKEILGKDVNQDSNNNKNTYVDLVGGIEQAKKDCEMYANNAINAIKSIENKIQYADIFYDFIESMLNRQK